MANMDITAAQYLSNDEGKNVTIQVTIGGQELFVSVDPANRHYAEIMRQVEAGTLTIAPAEEAAE